MDVEGAWHHVAAQPTLVTHSMFKHIWSFNSVLLPFHLKKKKKIQYSQSITFVLNFTELDMQMRNLSKGFCFENVACSETLACSGGSVTLKENSGSVFLPRHRPHLSSTAVRTRSLPLVSYQEDVMLHM